MVFLDRNKDYCYSLDDGIITLATGFSGFPYAKKHWELSNMEFDPHYIKTHRRLAVIEVLPVIGGIAALTERVCFLVKDKFYPESQSTTSWPSKTFTLEEAQKKMWINAKKAIKEHIKKEPNQYASFYESIQPLEKILNFNPDHSLNFRFCEDSQQGYRKTMEDAHFHQEIDEGVLAGVFDGHAGRKVAHYVSQQMQIRFANKLRKHEGHVHRTFEDLIHEIQQEILEKSKNKRDDWYRMGSTAVICFIDKLTHLIYTATLGDSEANIYRTINNDLKSIPLSCVRDWGSDKDAKRIAIATNDPDKAIDWPNTDNPKKLRIRVNGHSLNVSRSMGDSEYNYLNNHPGVIHKPKITLNQLLPGDKLMICCDGIKDFVSEQEIIEILGDLKTDFNQYAKKLTDYALLTSKDNVTVIVIEIK